MGSCLHSVGKLVNYALVHTYDYKTNESNIGLTLNLAVMSYFKTLFVIKISLRFKWIGAFELFVIISFLFFQLLRAVQGKCIGVGDKRVLNIWFCVETVRTSSFKYILVCQYEKIKYLCMSYIINSYLHTRIPLRLLLFAKKLITLELHCIRFFLFSNPNINI